MKYIHTADIHLLKSVPVCRPETESEWYNLQKESLEFLRDLTVAEDATLLIVGDIFDIPVASVTMVTLFLDIFLPIKDKVLILAGNHDLRGHNLNNADEASYGVLAKSFKQIPDLEDPILGGHHFNTAYNGKHKIVCSHQFVAPTQEEADLYGDGVTPVVVAEQYPDADLILLGDCHKGFIFKGKEKIVLNPGCMTRQSVKFVDYKPFCFVIDTEDYTIRQEFLPDCKVELLADHITAAREKDERTKAIIELVKGKSEITLDFEANLKSACAVVSKEVQREVDAIIIQMKTEK